MKKYLFLILATCILQVWTLKVSATKPTPYVPLQDRGYGTVTDVSGNVYVCGFFESSSITFGTITLTNFASGYSDLFIVKYDPAGNVLWAKSAGGSSTDVARNITTDRNGNVFVTGYFLSPTITFGTITLTNVGAGLGDMFIVKYNSSGTALWAKSAGGIYFDAANNLVTDAGGNVYVSGTFQSPSITFGSFTFTNPGAGDPGTWDTYLVKYDASGNVLWAKSNWYGAEPGGLATDSSSNVYLVGDFNSSSITFGSFTLTNSAKGYYDIYLAKFDANGNVQWATSAGGSNDDEGWEIALDGSSNVYITGPFWSPTLTFGETTLTNATSGNSDMYIAKYDLNGTVLWAKNAVNGAGGSSHGRSVATDGSGNIYVTGDFGYATITFGTIGLTNAGYYDVYLVKYDPSGNVLWARKAGGNLTDAGYGISTDGSGNVYMTGGFNSPSITFGTITLINTTGNNGDVDYFLAKYDGNGNVPWAKCAGAPPTGKPKSAIAGTNDPAAAVITVYPNPTSGKIIMSTDNTQSGITGISVYNMSGKQVESRQSAVGSQQVDVDLSDQPKGLYLLMIKAGDHFYQKKIIVE